MAIAPSNNPTVREIIALYLRLEARIETRRAKRAWEDRERVLGLFADYCGDQRVSELTRGVLKVWIDTKEGLKSDWTRSRWCRTIQRVFNWAVNDMELIPRNPLRGVRYKKGRRGNPMSDAQFFTLLDAARPEFAPVLKFCRWTGCRPGELAAAKWSDIQGSLADGTGVIILDVHKTSDHEDALPRVIALPPPVVELILELQKVRRPEDGPIFLNSKGGPWTNNSICDAFRALRTKCGFPADCKLYGARHAFGTQAIVNGVGLHDLADLMGHRSVKMTSHYLHTGGMYDRLNQLVAQAAGMKPPPKPKVEDEPPPAIC